MSLTDSSRSGGTYTAVFLLCTVLGYVLALLLPQGAWSVYLPILISYHLFLGWLLITADDKVGFSFPIVQTILTHLSFLTVVVGLAIGRRYIPLFGLVRYFIPAIAPFECDWLFSANKKNDDSAAVPSTSPLVTASAEDQEAWHQHLATRKPGSYRAGATIKEEYEAFLLARQKNRPAAPPTSSPDSSTTGAPLET